MTKVYECGAVGPDLEKSDIISYELGDTDIQFCLPKDDDAFQNYLVDSDQIKDWVSKSNDPLNIARADWKFRIEEDGWKYLVGKVYFSIMLIDINNLQREYLSGKAEYSIFDVKDLGLLVVDYFKELVFREANAWGESIDRENAYKLYDFHSNPKLLPIVKLDILPWFMNHRISTDSGPKRIAYIFIPLSEKNLLRVEFDFERLKQGDEWFFATDEEAEKFEAILREEFFSYFKVTYKQETLDKIKEYSES